MKRVAFSNAFNADFKEEKHKRDKDGKFSKSGSGGSSSKSKGGASSKKEAKTLESLYSKLLSAKTAEEQSKLKGEVKKRLLRK